MRLKKLSILSIEAIWKLIFKCGIKENENSRQISYFEHLPYNLRESILTYIQIHGRIRIGGTYYLPEAKHFALFLHDDIEELDLSRCNSGHTNNLKPLFTIGGEKLKNLKKLTLPIGYQLTTVVTKNLCEKLSSTTPNLQVLNIETCGVPHIGAFRYITTLPLVHLESFILRDEDVEFLCHENSKLKDTLKVLHTRSLSGPSYCLILKTIKSIEEIHCSYSSRFNLLLKELGVVELNLRRMEFEYMDDVYEDEMNLAALMCPNLREICIDAKSYTQKMIKLLIKFKYLSKLFIHVQFEDDDEMDFDDDEYSNFQNDFDVQSVKLEKSLSYEMCADNFGLPNLLDFTLVDFFDKWISPGYLFTILEMCPNIEKLKLEFCSGFSNKVAAELAKFMWDKKLKHLIIYFCTTLQPSGIEDLLRIPTLQQMEVDIVVNRLNRLHLQTLDDIDSKCNYRKSTKVNVNVHVVPLDI